MNTMQAITTRRSVREFDSTKPIPQEIIETLLQAAMSAPSALNQQSWHFIVVTNPELLAQIPKVSPHAQMCLQAKAAIIPCADLGLTKIDLPFWTQDLAAATQNILLAARAEGLGAVWTGIFPNQERVEGFKKLFSLPDTIVPFAAIPLGYTKVEQTVKSDRFRPERIHYNCWK